MKRKELRLQVIRSEQTQEADERTLRYEEAGVIVGADGELKRVLVFHADRAPSTTELLQREFEVAMVPGPDELQ